MTDLVADTRGPVLELGAGDGALTRRLAALGRKLTVIEIDEHRVRRLRERLPGVDVVLADALSFPLQAPVVVGNVPFHLTTPILRRLLSAPSWEHAILLTQWEVARKRAGVGGRTMMSAQSAPWFEFALDARVPARAFSPMPSVDGGILVIRRRRSPLVPGRERRRYEAFVKGVFTGRGGRLDRVVARAGGLDVGRAGVALSRAGIARGTLPRDLDAEQWAALWAEVSRARIA